MKQLIFVLILIIGFHTVGTAQESKEKVTTKVEGSGYKKKVEAEGSHHIVLRSQGSQRAYPRHHYYTRHRHYYTRHRRVHARHIRYRRHVYHRPVIHYKKFKKENKNGKIKYKA